MRVCPFPTVSSLDAFVTLGPDGAAAVVPPTALATSGRLSGANVEVSVGRTGSAVACAAVAVAVVDAAVGSVVAEVTAGVSCTVC